MIDIYLHFKLTFKSQEGDLIYNKFFP